MFIIIGDVYQFTGHCLIPLDPCMSFLENKNHWSQGNINFGGGRFQGLRRPPRQPAFLGDGGVGGPLGHGGGVGRPLGAPGLIPRNSVILIFFFSSEAIL